MRERERDSEREREREREREMNRKKVNFIILKRVLSTDNN